MNQVRLYTGAELLESVNTELNISPDFVQMKLAKEFEKTGAKNLWGVIQNLEDLRTSDVYVFDNNNGLRKMGEWISAVKNEAGEIEVIAI